VKPSVSIDERGVLLHLTDPDGKGFSVALNAERLTELSAQLAFALERIKGPERSELFWSIGRAVVREILIPTEGKTDGPRPPEPDPARKEDR